MKKRIMALLLSLVMALSLVPTTVWAAGASSGDVVDNGIATQASMSWTWTVTIFGDNYYKSDGTKSNTNRYTTNKSLDNSKDNEIGYKFEWNASAGGRVYKGGWQLCITVNGAVVERTTAYVYTRNMSTASGSWTAPGSSHTGTSSHPFTLYLSSFPKETSNCNHDYDWKDNGDGTHTGTCKNCNDKVTEGHNDGNGDGFCDKCGACLHDKDNKGYCTVKDCQHIKDGKSCCQKENPAPTEPADPKVGENFDFSENIVDVICKTNNNHNDSYGLMNGYYSVSNKTKLSNGNWQCALTINLKEYFNLYNSQHSGLTHTREKGTDEFMTIYPTWYADSNQWVFVSTNTAKIYVKCDATQPEGPGDTKPTFSEADGRIKVICVVNPANHNPAEKTYNLSDGTYTDNGSTMDQAGKITYSISLDRNSFIKKFDTDTNKTHTDKETNADTRITWTWNAKEKVWVLDTMTDTVATILCECETTVEKCPVHVVIYRNGDTSKAYKDIALESQPKGYVIDLTELNIADYYTANYTGQYDFYGWYDDGLMNIYNANVKAGKDAPAGLTTKTVNGWTNIKCMVYDYEKVVYFQTKEALADYQKDHSKTEGLLFSTTARKGSALPTADAPTATRKGYTFLHWSREGQTSNVTGQTVGGWTNLYANWEPTQYKITYDLRDGKASNNPANPATYTVEDTVTLQAPTTKRNNQFLEWRDGDGNVITEIAAGTTGNVKVYAYWKCPIKLYELTANGKVQLGNTIYVTEGTSYPLPDGSTYAKNGYTFKCWYETEGNLTANKNQKTAVTPTVTKEWKLYGKNIPVEYTITYVLNDKDAKHTNQTTYTVEDEFAITDATNGSFGRKFLEWRAADSKTGKAVNKIEKGTTGSITLYAIWQNPVNYFQVDKDGNKTLIRTDYVTVHEDYQTIAAIDKAGYTFDGWYKSTKDFGADSKKVTGFTATNSKAEWKLYGKLTPNKYTVTFDVNANGDKSAKVNPADKEVTFDAAYGDLANASRAGYTFQGWFTAKEGGTEVKSDDIVKTAGNHTLYAHWEITPHNVYAYLRTGDSIGDVIRLEKSTLDRLGLSEYNKNGFIPVGKFVSNTVLAEDEYYGADEDEAFLNVIKELKANIKLGAVGEKINWSWLYTPADVDDRIDGYLANDKEGYQLSGTLTLYSVMFKTEDSENVKGMPKATYGTFYDYYIEGETITMPANPTRTGYDFKGWAVNGKTVDTTNGYTITGDVVFTAQWEKQTYTVKFDSMGGSKIDDQKVKYQDKAAEPKAPTKSGYTFAGWYTDKKCTKGNEFSFDTKITGNITLYAKWDVKRTGTNPDAKNPYIKDNTKKDDGKKVESGKTFDAGIAMYVGLSILSVTGSAVVIRKRKDF